MSRNPFLTGERYGGVAQEWVDSASRLDRVKDFSAEQCRAALELTDLQKSVRVAIERRLRKLEWLADQQKAVNKAVQKIRRRA